MTKAEALKLGCWMADALDTFERLGAGWEARTAALGSCPLFFLNRYAEGYQPAGAAIAFLDRFQQEYTR